MGNINKLGNRKTNYETSIKTSLILKFESKSLYTSGSFFKPTRVKQLSGILF